MDIVSVLWIAKYATSLATTTLRVLIVRSVRKVTTDPQSMEESVNVSFVRDKYFYLVN